MYSCRAPQTSMPHLFDFRGRSFALTNRGGLGPSRLPNDGGARGGRDDRIALGASVGGRTPPINHNDHRLRSGVRWSKSDEINPSSEESYFGRICRGGGKIKKNSSSHCWTNEKTEFSKSRVQGEGCYCDIIVENESTLCLHKT